MQAEKLYQTALDFAELKGNEIVYDLYSGAGTITIFISDKAKKVYAFEAVESAIADAKVNADLNNILNVKFFSADLYKTFLLYRLTNLSLSIFQKSVQVSPHIPDGLLLINPHH